VVADIVNYPEASLEDIELGVEKLGFSPASHSLRVMLGQAIALENYRDVDGILLLTCFRCAEGSLTRTVLRRYLQSRFNQTVIRSYTSGRTHFVTKHAINTTEQIED
jgi:activator of 2-hydroxyglutaryl-CoA dehydratase